MNVKNWKCSYNARAKQEVKQNILDTISLWVSIGLLWFSFVSILLEHFPSYLDGMDWWCISLYVIVLWIGFEWPQKYIKKVSLFCQALGVGIPFVYIIVQLERILDGIVSIANVYLPYINSYYKTFFNLL